MEETYISVVGPCGHRMKIPWREEFANKKMTIKCNICKTKIEFTCPSSAPIHTVASMSAPKGYYINAYLDLQQSRNYHPFQYSLNQIANKVGRSTQLNKPEISIAIPTADTKMSRIHFTINVYQNDKGLKQYSIVHNSKTNITSLNHQILDSVEEIILLDGDKIRAGTSTFIFRAIGLNINKA